ncbi:hypothetical protein EDF27_3500 [Curtobacterium sp. PhB136]|nr:hypothetical protein EDF27_3500 [Curtobacterium sp. PhB136]
MRGAGAVRTGSRAHARARRGAGAVRTGSRALSDTACVDRLLRCRIMRKQRVRAHGPTRRESIDWCGVARVARTRTRARGAARARAGAGRARGGLRARRGAGGGGGRCRLGTTAPLSYDSASVGAGTAQQTARATDDSTVVVRQRRCRFESGRNAGRRAGGHAGRRARQAGRPRQAGRRADGREARCQLAPGLPSAGGRDYGARLPDVCTWPSDAPASAGTPACAAPVSPKSLPRVSRMKSSATRVTTAAMVR